MTKKPAKPQPDRRTWADIAKADAIAGAYRPPQSGSRMSVRDEYVFTWEQHATPEAWNARLAA